MNIEHVLIFSKTFVWSISHSRRIERDVIHIHLNAKYPLFLSDIKTVVCSYEFALSDSVIVLYVSIVVSVETNRRHYFRSGPRN